VTATKPIRTAIVAVFAVVAIAASCAGAGEVAMQHPETGRKDVPVAGTRVGFALTMAKRDGSTFSCVDTVTHQRMASLSMATNGSVVTAVWRGHPKCGANFRVTARVRTSSTCAAKRGGFPRPRSMCGTANAAAREWRLVNPPHAYWNSDSYALNDDVDIGFDSKFPLWIFGFMY
jgi:hypothetical protein